jgi:hypothetical protein
VRHARRRCEPNDAIRCRGIVAPLHGAALAKVDWLRLARNDDALKPLWSKQRVEQIDRKAEADGEANPRFEHRTLL